MNAMEERVEEPAARKRDRSAPDQPISIYEVHLDSWMRVPEEGNRPLTCSEIAPKLAQHLQRLNFTHVQLLLPAPAVPRDLPILLEYLEQNNLGVIVRSADTTIHAGKATPEGETRLGKHVYQCDFSWSERVAAYFATDPHHRPAYQGQLTSRDSFEFSNSILPLSHRLVTSPRPSLLRLMPGDPWKKFANLRLLLAYTYLMPGKKLLFMGTEFAQENAWRPDTSLDWHLVREGGFHAQFMNWTAKLNHFYRTEPALHETDSDRAGFAWIDTSDAASNVISFLRQDAGGRDLALAVLNFAPVPRQNYRVGVPLGGYWRERLNSDAVEFGGSGQGNLGGVEAAPFGWNFQPHSLFLTVPPLGCLVLKGPA